ncbi:hypothetical protein M758_8G099000 [Ceratodon purpureus]|nr:hypothetical protein M758_8G099000 [Ceratodon purpureus]
MPNYVQKAFSVDNLSRIYQFRLSWDATVMISHEHISRKPTSFHALLFAVFGESRSCCLMAKESSCFCDRVKIYCNVHWVEGLECGLLHEFQRFWNSAHWCDLQEPSGT